MLSGLMERLRLENFRPSWVGIWSNPFWLCRRALYKILSDLAPHLKGRILDFGAGSQPYRSLLINATEYLSLEYDTPDNRLRKTADIFYDGWTIPLDDDSLDGLLSTQTLEHVPNPQRIVQEWARVLRPGGMVLVTVPFMWPEHEMPYDFQRYTTGGIRGLVKEAGFEVVEQRRLLAGFAAPVQLFIACVYDSLLARYSRGVRLIMTALLCAPITVAGIILDRLFSNDSNTYLDNVLLLRRSLDAGGG